jgi:hypothetical protein
LRRWLRGPRDSERRPAPPPVDEAEWERLAPSLLAHGPGLAGATGGSGTRVVARVMRRGGMLIGNDLNVSEDALDFAALSDRWIDALWAGGDQPDAVAELRALVARQGSERESPDQPWGWKEPRSVYLLPFLHRQLPTLRFLHVVRDGRDMAFSSNQVQLRKHGTAVLGADDEPAPVRSIALWSTVNVAAADYGEAELGDRYLRIRFEDLCAEPVEAVAGILHFFGLDADAERIASEEVEAPGTFGRWRQEDPALVARLTDRGEVALARFGYQSSSE